jgi:hypothetical protein
VGTGKHSAYVPNGQYPSILFFTRTPVFTVANV